MKPDIFDVSIIIPTHNRADLLPEAIESCLSQNTEGFKIQTIVIDDASTDDRTREVLAKYGDKVEALFLPKNMGQAVARNEGLQIATGRYVKFLDDDDVLEKGSLYKEVHCADTENADIVVSGFAICTVDPEKSAITSYRIKPPPDMNPVPDTILLGRQPFTSAALYKNDYIKDLKWDPGLRIRDDWDWFCRACLRKGKIVSTNCVSYWWRDFGHSRASKKDTLLMYARESHKVLNKIEETLAAGGELTKDRKKNLAKLYYKELRVLGLYDRETFEKSIKRIYSLYPRYIPADEERQKYMRFLCRLLGTRRAILFHSFVKRMVKEIIETINIL